MEWSARSLCVPWLMTEPETCRLWSPCSIHADGLPIVSAESYAWLAVALLGIGNIFLGRLVALIGVPHNGIAAWPTSWGLFSTISWMAGWAILYWLASLRLTFLQACILALLLGFSYRWTRTLYAMPLASEGWGSRMNQMLKPIAQIAQRHGWDLDSADSVSTIIASGRLQFDGADYDAIVSSESDRMHELRRSAPPPQKTPAGEIDYARECARWVVTTERYLSGRNGIPGMLERIAREHNLEGFDHASYSRLQRLASGLYRARGAAGIFGGGT